MNSQIHDLPLAPEWALKVGQVGQGAVIAAIVFFALAILTFLVPGKEKIQRLGPLAFGLGSLSLATAFGCLVALFVENQFQFEYVFARADIHTELKYKVAGVWSGQQGSFLLWGVCSAIFGILAMPGTGAYRRWFGITYSLFLGSIAGILAYETPFGLIKELVEGTHVHMPPTGNGMTPSLQNYWLVIHPPTIFLGFGALTVLFAYAVSAILSGDVTTWAKQVRPWAILGLAILGLGICMGGFWAYETLGWGGFWMWDPVENASFVPWLVLAAFVHGLIIQISRSRWHGTNLWLAALPFLCFVYGTFLTRSGVLGETSVHSFANMDTAALNVLKGLMGTFFVGFVTLYLVRGRKLALAANRPLKTSGPIHREGLYSLGSTLLAMFALVLAVGMSWPLFMALAGKSAARVEEPLYHQVVVWFFVPIIVLIGVAPFVSWRGIGGRELAAKLTNILAVAAGSVGFLLIALREPRWGTSGLTDPWINMPFGLKMPTVPWIAFLLVLCFFAAFANIARLVASMRRSKSSAGAFLSHFGMATLLAGLIVSRGFEREEKLTLRPNRPGSGLDYQFAYDSYTGKSQYDRDSKLVLNVTGPDGVKFKAEPSLFYNKNLNSGQDEAFVWPHIERAWSHDVYVALGKPLVTLWQEEGEWFRPGETRSVDDTTTVHFEKLTSEGQLGTADAKFTAHLTITLKETDTESRTYKVKPSLSGRMEPDMPFVGNDLRAVLMGMDAKDKSIRLQMVVWPPVYSVHVFTKPLTALVWGGTGIMFLGGLMSAWSRRRVRVSDVVEETTPDEGALPSKSPKSKDAPLPAT